MPRITKLIDIQITVEQFLSACSTVEIQEIMLLAPKYYSSTEVGPEDFDSVTETNIKPLKERL